MKGFVLCSALLLLAISASAQQPVKGLKHGMTVELTGGFARTQFNTGPGGYPNMNGFFGSVGVNILPWLQVQADASAQYGSVTGANTRIYGNHFGPRVFYRPFQSATFVTFGEFLAGGSRLDLNVNGPGGGKFSENGFSFKAGGGMDWHISPHWSVRVFDADYYRTSFLTTHQNNLWISTGIVFTLGGGRAPR
ncbi:MAG TPA: outer membrane beta-barrel protein [Candidatus Acidoferrales bacterium]|nr:outer membrane beta-barrel protein [Candidatus Acidoferrales bacterium]